MIYVYAITDPLDLRESPSGIEDAPLELAQRGGLAGVFSVHDRLEVKSDPELLWAHERVVDHLMELGGVLPLRFGTVLRDAGELEAVLGEEGPRYRLLLSRVRGCVELAVRVGMAPAQGQAGSGGADYMRERLAARRREEDAAGRVLAPLRQLARATAPRPPQAAAAMVGESYLVPRGAMEPFAAEVKALQERNPTLAISCTGPWGPYSFVDGARE